MKVLYIGHYKEASGYGQAAQETVLALDAAGVDVVPRPVKLSSAYAEIDDRILELEQKSSANADVCIQNVLPHLMDYNGHFRKNIGYFFLETYGIRYTSWPSKLKTMDELWLTDGDAVASLHHSGVNTPIRVIDVPCDADKYRRSYEPLLIDELAGNYVFYTICDLSRRKNLAALVKAFHLEFGPHEPVSLLIKAGSYGKSEKDIFNAVSEICNKMKEHMKLYPKLENYHREVVITTSMSNFDICRLHASADCYVAPSFGEGWNIPAFDAAAFGKQVIATDIGGMNRFLCDYNNCELIACHHEPVMGMTESFSELYSAREEWGAIEISRLRGSMRNAYENRGQKKSKWAWLQQYSYSNVGHRLKELLK